MKHSAVSAKASFRRKLAQRSGSIYVEASMVMPLTCLVMAGLIAVIMSFYGAVAKQSEDHIKQASEWYVTGQIEVIRRNGWHII